MPQMIIPQVLTDNTHPENNLWRGREYHDAISRGAVPGTTSIHKFGRNPAVGITSAPICLGGVYQTPAAATALEVVSDDANDTAAGTGAREVYIQGLDANFDLQEEYVATNGLTPVATANNYMRVFRTYVTKSGTYATQSAGSHVGDITIREAGAGATWVLINFSEGFPNGQSQIACYTIPNGKRAYLHAVHLHAEANKPVSLFLFKREDADVVTPPYGPMRLVQEWDGVSGDEEWRADVPIVFPPKTDIGWMGVVGSSTAAVSIDFELVLEDI